MKNFFNTIIILLIGVLIIFFTRCNIIDKEIKIQYINGVEENIICNFNDKYYYSCNDGVYSDNKCIIQTSSKPLIFSNNSKLFVCYDGIIFEYNQSLNLCSKYDLQNVIKYFCVSEQYILYFDSNDSYYVVKKETLKNVEENKTEIVEDQLTIHYYDDFIVCYDSISKSTSVFDNNNNNNKRLLKSVVGYSNHILNYSDNYIISTSLTNTSSINIFKYNISKNDNFSKIELPTFYNIISLLNDKNNIIFIGNKEPIDPHLDFSQYSILKYHQSDCLSIIDIENFQIINTLYTRQYEKIIFANSEILVTYYNGKYIVYSIYDQKKISSQKADEIIEGGSYIFETCGDYIFVFDDNTGELINRISIDF